MLHKSKRKKILTLILAMCFTASLLFPVGFILVNTNHTHVCCSGEYSVDNRLNNVTSICCIICISIHIAKISIAIVACSNNVSIFLYLLAVCITYRSFLVRGSISSPVALKVRMNN